MAGLKEPLSHLATWAWVKPWPVTLSGKPPDGWQPEILTVQQCLDHLDSFWPHKEQRVRARTALKNLKEWFPYEHHISRSIARSSGDALARPVLMVLDGKIIDGNHRLMALGMKRRFKELVLVLFATYAPTDTEIVKTGTAAETTTSEVKH